MVLQSLLIIIYLYAAVRITRADLFLRSLLLFIVALYGLQLVLATEDPYNFYRVSTATLFLFNLQIIFILIGIKVGISTKKKKVEFNASKVFNVRVSKSIIVLQSVLLLLTVLRYNKMKAYVFSVGNMASLARDYYFTDMYDSYSDMFLNSIVDSFIYVSFFLTFSLLLFVGEKRWKEWYVIITTILIVILKTVTSLGRGVIVQLFIVFLLFFFYSYREDKKVFKKTVKPVSIGLASLVTIFFIITTLSRFDLEGSDFLYDNWEDFLLKPFATYFYVPICAFDYGKERIFGDLVPMLGVADLAAPIDLFLTPFRFIDHDIISINNILGSKMTPQFSFPSGERWNALFTGASNYFIDFGFLGFIIFPFIHGLLLAKVENRSKASGAWFAVLVFLFLASFNHMKSSEIQSISTVFTLFWIFLIAKTKAISK